MASSRARRAAALVGVAALALLGCALLGAPAAQASGGEQINDYQVQAVLDSDGTLKVVETIVYDFGTNQRHGIYRTIPVRYDYDKTYERILKVDDLSVTSDAPDDVKTSNENGSLVIRVGDENKTVTGVHTYTIRYQVRGAVNALPEHVELSWNAIGTEWSVPIVAASVRVSMPGPVTGTACFAGPEHSALPCASTKAKGTTATFTDADLQPYDGLTVVVAAPLDSVAAAGAAPILDERFSVTRAFAVTPATASLSGVILLLGVGGVLALLWRHGRDRLWPGVTPGLTPPGDVAVETRRPLFSSPEGPVEFQPPADLRPGQLGLILDERADTLDVSATVVDLAVRGYLRIEELKRAHWFASRDWRLTRLRTDGAGSNDLLPYESLLLGHLFATGDEVDLSDLKKTFAPQLAAVRKAIETDAVRRGYFRTRPDTTRSVWTVVGVLAVALGVGLTWLLAMATHLGLLGLAVVAAGVVLLASAHRMPARTAKGSAAFAQVLGFRRYVATAEVEQLRFEESVDVFSRYLPYAMVFGETERWAKALAALAAAQAATGSAATLGWYSGPSGWDLGSLGDGLGSFAESSASSFSATAGSSGGSAGSSGGGMGGGGGGSW